MSSQRKSSSMSASSASNSSPTSPVTNAARHYLCQGGENCDCKAVYEVDGKLLCGRHCPQRCRKAWYMIPEDSASPVHKPLTIQSEPNKIVFFNTIKGEYSAFSTFYEANFTYKEITWKSIEHAYNSMKFFHTTGNEKIDDLLYQFASTIRKAPTPFAAKKLGESRQLPIRKDWNSITSNNYMVKEEFMYDIVYARVKADSEIRKLLLGTGNSLISEGSTDNDFWSLGTDGKGKNALGEVYMLVRDKIREEMRAGCSQGELCSAAASN